MAGGVGGEGVGGLLRPKEGMGGDGGVACRSLGARLAGNSTMEYTDLGSFPTGREVQAEAMARWIRLPSTVGGVLAVRGARGVGKSSLLQAVVMHVGSKNKRTSPSLPARAHP